MKISLIRIPSIHISTTEDVVIESLLHLPTLPAIPIGEPGFNIEDYLGESLGHAFIILFGIINDMDNTLLSKIKSIKVTGARESRGGVDCMVDINLNAG